MMRCLVVGIGNLALNTYLPFLVTQPDLDLAALSRRTASTLGARDRFGASALTSWTDVKHYRPDIAFVLTTDSQHDVVLEQLIAAGVPRLFVEKPLVARRGQERVTEGDFPRAVQLTAQAEAAGIEIAMGFNYRFFETVQRARAHAATRPLGRPTAVVADAHYACWSHTIDLLQLFCGPIATVTALAGSPPAEAVTPPRSIAFTTATGVSGTLSGSASRSWEDDLLRIVVYFEGGHIEVRDLDVAADTYVTSFDTHDRIERDRRLDRWPRYAASFRASLSAYLDAVRRGESAPVGVAAGLRELQFEAAVARSVSAGRAVDLELEFGLELPKSAGGRAS